MRTLRLVILAVLSLALPAGCATLLPGRVSVGTSLDAETLAPKTYSGTLFWDLKQP